MKFPPPPTIGALPVNIISDIFEYSLILLILNRGSFEMNFKSKFLDDVSWKLALFFSFSGCVLWWIHTFLNHFFPPFDTPFDVILFVMVSICKIVTILLIPFLLRFVSKHLYHESRMILRAIIFWTVGLLILMFLLSVNRDLIAELLSTHTIKLYYVNDNVLLFHNRPWEGREQWLLFWNTKQIQMSEFFLGISIIFLFSIFSYYLGKKVLTVILMIASSLALLIFWPGPSGFLFSSFWGEDYIFEGGIFSSFLVWDLLIPFFAHDPYTQISLTVLFIFILTSVLAVYPKRA